MSIGIVHMGSVHAQQVQIKGPKSATPQFSGSTYGPITSSDTLWRIANRYRQNQDLTVYQVMQAIYELNPDAFEQGNVNLLRNGAILNLPSARYVARIDPAQAQQRAERDESNFQPGTGGAGGTAPVVVPPESAVSKEDLSATKEVLELKLTAIDEEQNRQFMAIRQQFAESINSVQSLLDENKKIYDSLDNVNTEIDSLRNRVDVEIQDQMDEILGLQRTMLQLSQEEEARRKAALEESSFAWLSDPMTMAIAFSVLTLSLLVGFGVWMMGRNKSVVSTEEPILEGTIAPIVEQNSEMDDLSDALADELSGELGDEDDDLFGEDDLLDDVLSEELQESLDEALDEELESFDDLGDEMLVQDSEQAESASDDLFEDGESVLAQDDLDNLFDEDDDDLLAEIDEESIDLADTDELDDDTLGEADAELDQLLDEDELDELLEQSVDSEQSDEDVPEPEVVDLEDEIEEEVPESAEEDRVSALVDDDQEKPEISIDELLEEPQAVVPESIEIDESEGLNEETLQQLDKEIASQNQEIDKVTDELLNEIEQLEQMGDFLDDDEEEIEESAGSGTAETQMGIQQLDDLSEDLDDVGESDDLSDELLAEMGVDLDSIETDPAPEPDTQAELEEPAAEAASDMADELLAEMGIEDTPVEENISEPEPESDAEPEPASDMADELLAEMGIEETPADEETSDAVREPEAEPEAESDPESEPEATSDMADELLAEMGIEETPVEEETSEAVPEPEAELEAESDPESEPEAASDMAEELLAEMGIEATPEDAVADDALAEVTDQSTATETDENVQADSSVEIDVAEELASEAEAPADSELEAELNEEVESDIDTSLTGESVDELLAELDESAPQSDAPDKEPQPEIDEAMLAGELDATDANDELPEPQIQDATKDNLNEDTLEESLEIPAIGDEQFEQALEEFESEDGAQSDQKSSLSNDADANEERALNLEELDEIIPSLDDIESMGDIDDSELEAALESFDIEGDEDDLEEASPAATQTGTSQSDELDDLPGLGDWLSDDEESEDLKEIEAASFDELLQSIDEEVEAPKETPEQDVVLDNPDLDLEALLTEGEAGDELAPELVDELNESPDDFLDVDALLNESIEAESDPLAEKELNLDVALGDYTGAAGDADLIDVDSDKGMGAKLDLARAYIEIDDNSAAKSVLEDVIAKGDEEQSAEAKTLLENLGKA